MDIRLNRIMRCNQRQRKASMCQCFVQVFVISSMLKACGKSICKVMQWETQFWVTNWIHIQCLPVTCGRLIVVY